MIRKQPVIVLGTYSFAEEVADLISECDRYELVAFAENWRRERCDRKLLGYPIIWVDDVAPLAATHQALCAIGTPRRSMFVEQVAEMGFQFATLQHPTARVSRTSAVGAGSILSAGVITAAYAEIGRHVIVNRGSLIGHHTTIADYVTISPGSNIAGRVAIGDHTYIGMGAVILNDIKVGSHAVVGAGAVVTRDVPDRVQVLGVPARITQEKIGSDD
jgi:acetyltransferase EpsM